MYDTIAISTNQEVRRGRKESPYRRQNSPVDRYTVGSKIIPVVSARAVKGLRRRSAGSREGAALDHFRGKRGCKNVEQTLHQLAGMPYDVPVGNYPE